MNCRRALLLLAVLAVGRLPAAVHAAEESDVIGEKAAELVREHDTRAAKIVAVHSFVRDEIREVPTQWG